MFQIEVWKSQESFTYFKIFKFLGKTGLKRQSRELAGGFGVRQATTAAREAEQYYQKWSRSIGVNDSIKTLAKYYNVKYNDSPRFELLKRYADSVDSGRMSPMARFDLYEEYYKRIQEEIVGKTVNGITVSGQTAHFLERVFGTGRDPKTRLPRNGVSIGEIIDCLDHPVSIGKVKADDQGRRSFVVFGETATVSINADTGLLVQTNPWG